MIRKLMSLCLLVIAASAYAQTQPSPPWGPATSSSGTYNINWNSSASGTATILEERIGGSTTWIPIDTRLYQFSGNYYMAFTNKAAGQYYYRINVAYATPYGVTWMSSNQILVTVGSGGTPPPSADSLSNQRAYVYETRRGDLNGDGRLDLFVNRTSGGQPGNGSLGNFVLQQLSNGNFSVINPSSAQIATASSWQAVNVNVAIEDFNFDGFADMTLGKLHELIPGATDQIVYASAAPSVNAPRGIKAIDTNFRKFLGDVTEWIAKPQYFESTAPVVQVPVWGYEMQCVWVSEGEDYYNQYCYPVVVFLGYALAYDFSGFSQPALNFKRTYDEVGTGPLDSTRAGLIKQVLDGQLGVSTGLSTVIYPDDVIWLPWPGTRGSDSPWLARFLFRLNLILVIAQLPGDTPNFTYYHYTNAVGTAGILSSGAIMSSSGLVYMTQTMYGSSQQALSMLALPTAPTNAFILMSKEMGPPMPVYVGIVQPRYGQPGGGQEWTKLSPVPIGLQPRVIMLGP